ncbi:MAG: ABC-three component system middle component 6 [Microgenomates group bacterium]
MILPKKHVKLAESSIGLGAIILSCLSEPKAVDELWKDYQKLYVSGEFPAYHSFDNFTLTLDFLFMLGTIKLNNDLIEKTN